MFDCLFATVVHIVLFRTTKFVMRSRVRNEGLERLDGFQKFSGDTRGSHFSTMIAGTFVLLFARVPGCQKLQMTAQSGPARDVLSLYPYDNSGRQRVNWSMRV